MHETRIFRYVLSNEFYLFKNITHKLIVKTAINIHININYKVIHRNKYIRV